VENSGPRFSFTLAYFSPTSLMVNAAAANYQLLLFNCGDDWTLAIGRGGRGREISRDCRSVSSAQSSETPAARAAGAAAAAAAVAAATAEAAAA